jgi:uncharacterized protein DUF4269
MQKGWGDLTDLLRSTATQQATYHPLEALQVFPFHGHFAPTLAGPIPLAIDISGSDLDMVCSVERGHHGGIR